MQKKVPFMEDLLFATKAKSNMCFFNTLYFELQKIVIWADHLLFLCSYVLNKMANYSIIHPFCSDDFIRSQKIVIS